MICLLNVFGILFSVAMSMTASAGNLFNDSTFTKDGGWILYVDPKATSQDDVICFQDGKVVIKSTGTCTPPVTAMQVIKKVDIDLLKNYRLKFTAKADKATFLEISYGLLKSPYTPYFIGNIDLISGEKNYEVRIGFNKTAKVDAAPCALRLLAGAIGNNTVIFSDISLEEILPLRLNPVWMGFLNVESPDSFVTIPWSLKNSKGYMVEPQEIRLTNDCVDLAALAGGMFHEKACAILYNEFTSENAGIIEVGVSSDWWMEVFVNGQSVFSTMGTGNQVHSYKPADHSFRTPVKVGRNLMAIKVLSGTEGWRLVCGSIGVQPPKMKFKDNTEWKAVDTSDVIVRESSALDLSSLVRTSSSEGQLPRLIVGKYGKLESQNQPGRPVRLNGFNFPGHWLLGFYGDVSDTEIENMVEQSCIQGYNLFRFMHVDAMSKSRPMCIEPALLQKVDWLLAKMRQNDIYMYLVMFGYAHFMPDLGQQGRLSVENKALMYLGDPQIREQWRYGAEMLMNHVNPHTGIAWKDDPTIACIEFYNEQEFGLSRLDRLSPITLNKLQAKFQEWLKNKYQSPEHLAQAWNSPGVISFSQAAIPQGGVAGKNLRPTRDYLSFCNALARENAEWCESVLRNVGYQGLTSQYNLPCWSGVNLVRFEKSQVASRNNYFHHPSGESSPAPGFWWGNRCEQLSSIGETSGYWRNSNATRFADRPFFMTEYNHPFWNQYQYECGLLTGAYAGLQGHDAIIIHDRRETMLKVDRPADSFCVDNNPVARASAFLSACLYLRWDVKAEV